MPKVYCLCGEVYNAEYAHIGHKIKCLKCDRVLCIVDPKKLHQLYVHAESQRGTETPIEPQKHGRVKAVGTAGLDSSRRRWGVAVVLVVVLGLIAWWVAVGYSGTRKQERHETVAAGTSGALVEPKQESTNVPASPPFSLPNGTNIYHSGVSHGYGRLTVTNGTDYDAAAKLVRYGETHRFVYVRANHDVVIKDIYQGTYTLLFASGTDWDVRHRRFKRDKSFSKFDEVLYFTVTDTQYSTYRVTLNPVPAGNAHTSDIDESEFEGPDAAGH